MNGMILAAGLGERLRPMTNMTPKPLFTIGGTTMIRNAIGHLYAHGIRRIAINLHHLGGMIKDDLKTGMPRDLTLWFSEEPVLLGTAGGIKGCEPFLKDDEFVVINSDILVNCDLHAAIHVHHQKNALATLVVRPNPGSEKVGILENAPDGRLMRYLAARHPEYAKLAAPPAPMMFTGIHILSPSIFGYIPGGRPVNISVEVYPPLLAAGAQLHTFEYNGYWADIGTPASYQAAQADLNNKLFTPYGIPI